MLLWFQQWTLPREKQDAKNPYAAQSVPRSVSLQEEPGEDAVGTVMSDHAVVLCGLQINLLVQGHAHRQAARRHLQTKQPIREQWESRSDQSRAKMKIASFNVQKFGRKKASDPNIIKILAKIVCRYDIILILEVVDCTGSSVKTLLEEINSGNRKHHYSLQISCRLGRTRYKEQFMFLYRDDLVDLIDTYQFDDTKTLNEDAFARDPYILRFRSPTTELQDLVLIPVHTTPEDSDVELDKLYDVFLDVKKKWKTDNVMILGDFNADGSYVSKKEMKTIRIRSDTNFHWLISDKEDTTASNKNDHSYDRIVVYGDEMLQAVVPNSAKAFNFQTAYGLSDEQTLAVSDHYPVEVTLKTKTPDDICCGLTRQSCCIL